MRVPYSRINSASLSGACLDAAADGESAMNSYIRHWSNASEKVSSANLSLDLVDTEVTAKSYTNTVPVQAGQVSRSVYGGALELVCGGEELPPAAQEPCAKLKVIVAGGVTDDELGDLDDAVNDLSVALGLKTGSG